MRGLKISKSPCSLLVLSILITICLLLNQFSTSGKTHGDGVFDSKARILKLKYEFEKKSLQQALQKASMSDRSIILTFVNQSWAKSDSILDLFLESFRIGQGTNRLLNHLLIIAEDSHSFRYCNSKHPHCFYLKSSATRNMITLSSSRLKLIQEAIGFGYSFAFTSADVLWLRNPLTEVAPSFEISISCEFYPINDETFGIKGDGGFFQVVANDRSSEFFKNCNVNRVLYPDSEHQSLCSIIANNNYVNLIGMKVEYLDDVKFASLCQPCDLSQIYTIHADCCENVDSKIHDLKIVLDEWRNFTANSASSKRSSLLRRAPLKCIG